MYRFQRHIEQILLPERLDGLVGQFISFAIIRGCIKKHSSYLNIFAYKRFGIKNTNVTIVCSFKPCLRARKYSNVWMKF